MTATEFQQAAAHGGTAPDPDAWRGFKGLIWRDSVSVRDFIIENYLPYEGDASFLAGPTERSTSAMVGFQSGRVQFTDLTSYPALVQKDVRRPVEQRWMDHRHLAAIMHA